MIVAHPDDEVCWGAGFVIRERWYKWTIICCSQPVQDPLRAGHFAASCSALGATPMMLDARDERSDVPLKLKLPDLSGFERIVTHNHYGEYGHKHHMQVHNAVRAVRTGNITGFGYGAENALPAQLNDMELSIKIRALKCYGHSAPTDHAPKWHALINRYFNGDARNLANESYLIYG
jgi:hypothetical protein